FCPARTSSTWPLIRASGSFTVNVLADDQETLCRVFASSGDRVTGGGWAASPTGPVLPDVLATVHCDVEAVHDGGDHELVVGRVRDLVLRREAGPLVFFRGGFGLELPS
ncbi:MAG: flavin reductase family protein, partial [Jatrophihabitantaceae bacterium]